MSSPINMVPLARCLDMDLETLKERVQNGEKVGPDDDLPREYREAATRMIEFHANSEVMGAWTVKFATRRAPGLERKMAVNAQVQDEIGHAQLLYRAAESLGIKTREEMLTDLANGDGKFINTFHYRMEEWSELPMIMFFVDGAGMQRQATLTNSSFEPYAHAMEKINFEEGFHVKNGEDILCHMATGSRRERELLQEAFDRWWPRIIQFFGPTDDQSTHHDFSSQVGLKIKTNDELRQQFLNVYLPRARDYGLEIPSEPEITYDEETGRYEVNEDTIDWDEFWQIAQNEYEPGVEMIQKRHDTQEAVSWVRDVLDSWEGSQQTSAEIAAD